MDILKLIFNSITTNIFLIIILIFSIIGIIFHIKNNRSVAALFPNIVVTLGILGTFVGILIGLLNFDVSDINKSIPTLLEGLKTAFITSIVGMIASIGLKLIFSLIVPKEDSKNDVQQDDPLELLRLIASGIDNLEKSFIEVEKSIVSCFRSDEEYSLLSQLKLIRQEIIDTRKEVINSFNTFADKIVKSNTDALIEALKKVIDDFNALLNELVSESFKELSSAMIKLNEWQENYKTHIDKTQDKINTLLNNMSQYVTILEETSGKISKIDQSLKNIDSSLGDISVKAEDISEHVESLKLQNETLKESIFAIKQIGEEAKSVMPAITEQINSLTGKLENTVLNVTEKFESNTTIMADFVEKSTKDIQKAVDIFAEKIQNSIEIIDKGLEEELTKALNSLAGSLAALSAKFVEDYQPLTEKLREVVRMAERIKDV